MMEFENRLAEYREYLEPHLLLRRGQQLHKAG